MRLAIVLACAVPLAACSPDPKVDVRNASVEEVADKVAAAGGSEVMLRPGEWQTRVTIDDIAIPGVPVRAQEQMKAMLGQQQTVTATHCVTPEQAKRPASDFFTGKSADNCRYDRFTMGGGKVDAVMRCTGDGGRGEMRMNMSGTYSAESAATTSEMVVNAGQGTMTMKARSDIRRTGECRQKEGNG